MTEDLWMYEYNRTFDNELNNGLTEAEAETFAAESADQAVYYSKSASMTDLRSELKARGLPITGRRSQLLQRILMNNTETRKQAIVLFADGVRRIITNNTEKRKQDIVTDPEITPEPTVNLTMRRIITNNTEKRKQDIVTDPEITPEPTMNLTMRRSVRLARLALPYF
jgi:hypothetical protein